MSKSRKVVALLLISCFVVVGIALAIAGFSGRPAGGSEDSSSGVARFISEIGLSGSKSVEALTRNELEEIEAAKSVLQNSLAETELKADQSSSEEGLGVDVFNPNAFNNIGMGDYEAESLPSVNDKLKSSLIDVDLDDL